MCLYLIVHHAVDVAKEHYTNTGAYSEFNDGVQAMFVVD